MPASVSPTNALATPFFSNLNSSSAGQPSSFSTNVSSTSFIRRDTVTTQATRLGTIVHASTSQQLTSSTPVSPSQSVTSSPTTTTKGRNSNANCAFSMLPRQTSRKPLINYSIVLILTKIVPRYSQLFSKRFGPISHLYFSVFSGHVMKTRNRKHSINKSRTWDTIDD